MAHLREKSRYALGRIDAVVNHGRIESGYKNARLSAGAGKDLEHLLIGQAHHLLL
ncbi:hypothetical protein D3C81_1955070 [compost metagenome]